MRTRTPTASEAALSWSPVPRTCLALPQASPLECVPLHTGLWLRFCHLRPRVLTADSSAVTVRVAAAGARSLGPAGGSLGPVLPGCGPVAGLVPLLAHAGPGQGNLPQTRRVLRLLGLPGSQSTCFQWRFFFFFCPVPLLPPGQASAHFRSCQVSIPSPPPLLPSRHARDRFTPDPQQTQAGRVHLRLSVAVREGEGAGLRVHGGGGAGGSH